MNNKGFSLLEITVAVLALGLTVTALLQMFDFSFSRYAHFSSDWKYNAFIAESRQWLRNKIVTGQAELINEKTLKRSVRFPDSFQILDLAINNYDASTYFVTISINKDKRKNIAKEDSETMLFCFRKR